MTQPRPSKRSNGYYCKIDVFPLIIVIFVLVVVFMVAADTPYHHRTSNLVKVKNVVPMPNALREDALRIVIERDGKIYFGTGQVTADELIAKLRDGLSTGSEKKVYINADARVRYGTVISVLDRVSAAGLQNVSFLTELRQ